MARRKAHTRSHWYEATAVAGGVMILVLVALGVKTTGLGLTAAVVQSDLIAYTNTERTQSNLGTLAENSALDAAAQAKANDMAQLGYFSHTGPDGQPPWHWFVAAGYDYRYAGENLAVRFSDSKEVVDAWMASPTHKANIVKPAYTEIGIGVADGMYQGMPATFVVQFFGTPKAGSAPTQEVRPVAITQQTGAKPAAAEPAPAVAGAQVETLVSLPAPKLSVFSRIVGFFSGAFRSLTASAVESEDVVIGSGVSTEQ